MSENSQTKPKLAAHAPVNGGIEKHSGVPRMLLKGAELLTNITETSGRYFCTYCMSPTHGTHFCRALKASLANKEISGGIYYAAEAITRWILKSLEAGIVEKYTFITFFSDIADASYDLFIVAGEDTCTAGPAISGVAKDQTALVFVNKTSGKATCIICSTDMAKTQVSPMGGREVMAIGVFRTGIEVVNSMFYAQDSDFKCYDADSVDKLSDKIWENKTSVTQSQLIFSFPALEGTRPSPPEKWHSWHVRQTEVGEATQIGDLMNGETLHPSAKAYVTDQLSPVGIKVLETYRRGNVIAVVVENSNVAQASEIAKNFKYPLNTFFEIVPETSATTKNSGMPPVYGIGEVYVEPQKQSVAAHTVNSGEVRAARYLRTAPPAAADTLPMPHGSEARELATELLGIISAVPDSRLRPSIIAHLNVILGAN